MDNSSCTHLQLKKEPGSQTKTSSSAKPKSASRVDEVDSEIVRRAAQGDRQAQNVIAKTYHGYAGRMLRRVVGPSPDLADLQQVALLRVLTSLPRYRGWSKFSTWVGGICINVGKDYLRRKAYRGRIVPYGSAHDLPEGESHRSVDPANQLEARSALHRCQEALAHLSDNHRETLMLRAGYEYSINEIAEITDSARSTTRLRLYYARKALRRQLKTQAA